MTTPLPGDELTGPPPAPSGGPFINTGRTVPGAPGPLDWFSDGLSGRGAPASGPDPTQGHGLPQSAPLNEPSKGPDLPEKKSLTDFMNDYRRDPAAIRRIQQKLKAAGYSVSVTGHWDTPTEKAFTDAAASVIAEQEAQPNAHTTLEGWLDDVAASGGVDGSKGYDGPTTTHVHNETVNLTDPEAARKLITDTLAEKLGRKPHEDEVSTFTQALNSSETANPQVQDGTSFSDSSTDPANPVSKETSTTSGGVNPSGYTDHYIDTHFADEETGVNRAKWFDIALQILSQPATGVSA